MSNEKFFTIVAVFALIDAASITLAGRDITVKNKLFEAAFWIVCALLFFINK